MITAATAGNPSERCHGAQNKRLARKVLRESPTPPVKDYHGHPPEISSGKWPRIPPVPNLTRPSHIKELQVLNDMIESLNSSFHYISSELDQCFKEFDKSLAEIQSFDIERDAHIADIVNESIHMDTIAFKSISNVTHQVISEFNPYRDGYDPKLICIVLNQLATSRIISLFQPHRDSYDSDNLTHGSAKNHCLPSSFCHAFVPYRDSYDQNQSWTMDSPDHPSGSSPHSRFAISSYLKYLSYQYSYDRGKKAEYLVESDGKQYRRKGMMTPAVNFSEDFCRSNMFGSITIQH